MYNYKNSCKTVKEGKTKHLSIKKVHTTFTLMNLFLNEYHTILPFKFLTFIFVIIYHSQSPHMK